MSGPPGSFVLNHLLLPPSSCFLFSITNSFLFCSPISLVYVLLKQGQPFLTSHFNAHTWQRLLLSIWGPPPRLPTIVLNFMSIFYFVIFQQLDIFFLLKIYTCMHVWTYAPVWRCLPRTEEGVAFLIAGVTGCCELPCGLWELIAGPETEQRILLSTKPS